ncbi:MAG: hypothetical protein WCP79_14575 [Bacillota bacterium]
MKVLAINGSQRKGGNTTLLINTIFAELEKVGATHAFDTMNHFLHKHQMVMVGSTYWNFGIGLESGEVASDFEGMDNMRNIAENIIWLFEKKK